MTIAVFSDIHANLPALEAVLDDLDSRRPDVVFCLGDLVGYNVWPNEVADAIRLRRIPTIAGNYDEGIGLASDDCGCAYKSDEDRARGAESIAYTNGVVTDRTRAFLRSLPRHVCLEFADSLRVLMVHGSPRKINEYLFEDRPDVSFHRMMEEVATDVMLFGHTHRPYHKVLAYETGGSTRYRHAINVGSVGKPKDGDPRACYVVLHVMDSPLPPAAEAIRVEFVRVPYDVERAARAIEISPLPDAFADMLRRAY